MAAVDLAEHEKELVGQAAAALVQDGMTVGLGTGSTVARLLPALAARGLDIRCVATSVHTHETGVRLGLDMVSFEGLDAPAHLDLAIDGADQVDRDWWLIKGGGAAHTREKAVVAAAKRFVVIVSSDKLVDRLTPPVPLELSAFGLAGTLRRLRADGEVTLRDVPPSPDGGVIADYRGAFDDPAALAQRLSLTTGVVEHGLFGPELVHGVLVGQDGGVRSLFDHP